MNRIAAFLKAHTDRPVPPRRSARDIFTTALANSLQGAMLAGAATWAYDRWDTVPWIAYLETPAYYFIMTH